MRKNSKMLTTAKAILNAIDEFFASNDITSDERKRLWLVLGALRGPDEDYETDEHPSIKGETTVVIRGIVLPKTAKADNAGTTYFPAAIEYVRVKDRARALAKASRVTVGRGEHFFTHVRDAAESLRAR